MKNTSISLGNYFDQFVQKQVSTGRYKNVSEVIRAGLRLLENEESKVLALRNAIQEGLDSALVEDFDFDLGLKVSGFSFKVSGQPTVKVQGNKLSSQAKSTLNRARRGETVQIFDINANIVGNSSYKLKKISPVCIELTN